MKTIIILIILFLSYFTGFSQDKYEYSLVTCYERFSWVDFDFYVIARVELGEDVLFIQEQGKKYPETKRAAYKEAKRFKSVIAVFNYMSKDNWEYIQAVLISEPGTNSLVYRWLLKRKL